MLTMFVVGFVSGLALGASLAAVLGIVAITKYAPRKPAVAFDGKAIADLTRSVVEAAAKRSAAAQAKTPPPAEETKQAETPQTPDAPAAPSRVRLSFPQRS